MTSNNDDRISGDIIAAFAADPDIHAVEIRARVRGGVVHLQGIVETLGEKTLAEQAALRIEGVRRVRNDLTVSVDGNFSDAEMERAARAALDTADLGFIGVSVEAGYACLMGAAENETVKARAMDYVAAVPGVRSVRSEIEAPPRPTDDIGLADDVAEALSEDPRLEFLDLQVRCEDGNVVLSGYILNEDQFDAATEVAESVTGIRSVENRMVMQQAPTV